LYATPNIIKEIKSRKMRLAGYVARMVEMNAYKILERDDSQDIGLYGRLILDWNLGK
jgi:hypothetical protein